MDLAVHCCALGKITALFSVELAVYLFVVTVTTRPGDYGDGHVFRTVSCWLSETNNIMSIFFSKGETEFSKPYSNVKEMPARVIKDTLGNRLSCCRVKT